MKRIASLGLLILLSLGIASRAAYAILINFPEMMISDGLGNKITIDGSGAVVASGTSGTETVFSSTNPHPGEIILVASLGSALTGWSLNVDTGQTKPGLSGTATNPQMDLAFVATSLSGSGTAGTLTISFSDGNYGPVAGITLIGSVGGTLDNGSVDYKVLFDPLNGAFTGVSVADTGALVGSPFGATVSSSSITGANPPGFSLTQVVTIVHTAAGTTTGDARLSAIPEPASLLLLGSGLAGFGYLRRRNRGKVTK